MFSWVRCLVQVNDCFFFTHYWPQISRYWHLQGSWWLSGRRNDRTTLRILILMCVMDLEASVAVFLHFEHYSAAWLFIRLECFDQPLFLGLDFQRWSWWLPWQVRALLSQKLLINALLFLLHIQIYLIYYNLVLRMPFTCDNLSEILNTASIGCFVNHLLLLRRLIQSQIRIILVFLKESLNRIFFLLILPILVGLLHDLINLELDSLVVWCCYSPT